jgi:hypothetical protein
MIYGQEAFSMPHELARTNGWRKALIISAMPSVGMLLLFYSLALHMRLSLGTWPTRMGEEGFSALLLAHVNVTAYYFIGLIWFGIFIWPVSVLVSVLVKRWRRFAVYFAYYAVMCIACWVCMQLAPESFLVWWWD